MKNNFIRIVKMTAYYSFLGLILQGLLVNLLFAITPAEGQNLRDVKVSVNAVNVSLEEALQIIESKTNFKFIFFEEGLPLKEKATVIVDDESLYNILEVFAKDYGLTFNRINDQIVVKKNQGQTENLVTAIETGTIKGKIMDASTKETLLGASVMLKGTTLGGYTNNKGNYEINNVKPGKYTLAVSYIGYSTAVKTVEVSANQTIEVNISLSQSTVNLDEVVVTGSLSERAMRAVANPITIVTAKELENRNLTSLGSVLESIPGIMMGGNNEIFSTRGTAYSYIYIRGGAPLSNVVPGAGIKYIVDGVELSDPSFLDGLNPNDIDKIEVSRGPMSSTLYGAGSSSGVIQIFTKRGGMNNLRVNFRTMLTSQKSKMYDSDPLNQDYSLNVSGGQGELGYSFGVDRSISPVSRYKRNNGIDFGGWNINAGVRARLADLIADVKFQYSYNNSGSSQNDYLYKTALADGWSYPSKLFFALSDNKNFSEGVLASLNLKQILGEKLYHNLTVGYARNGFENTTYTASQYGPTTFIYPTMSRDFRKYDIKYFMNLNQPLSTDFNVDITGGFDYVDYRFVDMMNTFSTKQADYTSQSEAAFGYKSIYPTTTTGLFGEAVWSYNNDLFLTTGLRAEKNSGYGDDLGWYTMPRVGLTYVQTLGDFVFKPRGSWGKSSEPANPYYKMGSVGTSTIYQPNPNLKPQNQSGYELGADIYYSSSVVFNVTYYKQQMGDLIVRVLVDDPTTSQTDYQYQNVTKADNSGWEFSARFLYSPFTLDLSYTSVTSTYGEGFTSTSNPNIRPGKRIPDIPSGSFFARLSSRIPSFLSWSDKGGTITLEYRWNGNVFAQDYYGYYKAVNERVSPAPYPNSYNYYNEFPGYSKFNLRADYSILNNLLLFVDVQNLLDNQDWISGSAPMIGRQISFGFNFQY
ncbi:MAG: TonB-dependent receptor [Melioribacter sp.]|nr:TonB-dependent receptor [Melioribacter sp.]